MIRNILIVYALLFIYGCSSSQTFVANKATLDPFSIYSYQTLSLPPIYFLSAKEMQDERRFAKESSRAIEDLFFNRNVGLLSNQEDSPSSNYGKNMTSGDMKILDLTNANKDYANIREKINEESLYEVVKEPNFIEKLFKDYNGEALDDQFAEYQEYNPTKK